MTSERIQRRIGSLLEEADEAVSRDDWATVRQRAEAALRFDPTNVDALSYLEAATRDGTPTTAPVDARTPTTEHPATFVAGRYAVRRFLGEGGKKRVYLAHDERLDRDVAFALIKTEGLDEVGRQRITREAQAMGRLGAHPHVVSVFDLGEEAGAPYIVTELLEGGDVAGELERAGGALDLSRALEIGKGVVSGLAFAHERGIVHRDLKPGNVWLTDSGIPKIGDFGLAVAEGRSRLTQHGLMVGTFGYMPPEQALGNEATPRSDLYSLGAMLYELVTGQQPFTGETSTAVISQHLNTPPVAPSWHTEHCPPALEDLILALLAKEPEQRPASAAAVLAVLEGIDPSERSRSRSDSAANPLDRLASGVFVGRERELERLRTALDGALAGRGSLVMLVGEPGIGKTRTTQELETYARMRGAKVLWGRANEAAGAPPYWPWVQVGRAYRDQTPEDEVRRRQYQPYAVELQRIFPALRDLFPNLPEAPDADSEGGQFRLYDALTSFLRDVAAEQPLVVVLDDLHWADSATLALLTHLTRDLGRARLLVLGTYRDTDLDRRHPLSTALADLNREDLFTRIPLRGLTLAETSDYVRRTAGTAPAPALVQRIHEETEGNPFFLAEVVNLMAEEGTLSAPLAEVQIPEGVRQALGRRLDRLSDDANALLSTLAVVGREFDHALVLAVSSHDDVTTLRLVEEALRARVLEETGAAGRYRFRHALMQQTLLEELSAARRVLLHGQIAEALLSTYGVDNRDHLRELAEHYAESAVLNPAHARLAASTLRRAAESAATALAWDEATRLYERCVNLVLEAPDRFGEDEAALWSELAFAQLQGSDRAAALRALHRALGVSAAPVRQARALVRVLDASIPEEILVLREAITTTADALRGTPSIELCEMLGYLAYIDYTGEGDRAEAEALEVAQQLRLDRKELPYRLRIRPLRVAFQRGEFRAAYSLAQEMRGHGVWRSLDTPPIEETLAAGFAGEVDLWADSMRARVVAFQRTGSTGDGPNTLGALGRIAWRRGDAGELERFLSELKQTSLAHALLTAEIAAQDGSVELALQATPGDEHPTVSSGFFRILAQAVRARLQYLNGDLVAARASLSELEDSYRSALDLPSVRGVALVGAEDAVCQLAREEWLEEAYSYFGRYPEWRCAPSGAIPDYVRGALALRLDRPLDEAEDHFRTGLAWASRPDVRFEVDAGRCQGGLAEVAERRGDHALAMQHLDAAGALFAKHGAKLYLDQVIAKKSVLGA